MALRPSTGGLTPDGGSGGGNTDPAASSGGSSTPSPLDQDRDQPDRTGRANSGRGGALGGGTPPPNPLTPSRAPLSLRMKGNKRAGDVSPKVRSRRKSRSFRVR